jgi:predicted Rossmann fold flavoprotein
MGAVRELVVVGAGAAGTWVAWRAAEAGLRDVLLVEKTERVGTKILASGGSRCNLTTTLGPREAGRLFGTRGERFLRRAFDQLAPVELRRLFEELGVPSEEAPLEKVFPKSGSAKDVRDSLEAAARAAGVEIELEAPVVGLESAEESEWDVRLESGELIRTRRLVLATGGQSFASTGTTGDAYAWLRGLGLRLVEPAPALVPLTSPARWVGGLAGIALQDAELRLHDAKGKEVGRRRRPLLFTHVGVSGPGPMDLSRAVGRAPGKFELRVDLVPDHSRDELREALIEAGGRAGAPQLVTVLAQLLARLAGEPIPRRLVELLLEGIGLTGRAHHQSLGRAARHELIESIKGLVIPIDGTAGFDKAEVTSGGLHLGEVDPGTCRVRGRHGLWVVGELLDLDGPIGGLNFQSAFATAELAARDISRAALE